MRPKRHLRTSANGPRCRHHPWPGPARSGAPLEPEDRASATSTSWSGACCRTTPRIRPPRLARSCARAETVATHPLFASAFRDRRAIVPMSVYYQRRWTAGSKQLFAISRSDGEPDGRRRALGGVPMAGRHDHPHLLQSSRPMRIPSLRRSTTGCWSCWKRRTGRCGSENNRAILRSCCGHRQTTFCMRPTGENRGRPQRRLFVSEPSGRKVLCVFLAASRHDHQRVVRQRSLQLERFLDRRRHPDLDFLARRQDDGHRFRVIGADQLVRFGRQEGEDVNGSLALLQFPDRGPLASRCRQRRPVAASRSRRTRSADASRLAAPHSRRNS